MLRRRRLRASASTRCFQHSVIHSGALASHGAAVDRLGRVGITEAVLALGVARGLWAILIMTGDSFIHAVDGA
jgi:hypothetical protein